MRFLCLVRHKRGHRLYRYASLPTEIAQRPDLRGRVGFVDVGFECSRCGKKVETP